MLLKKISVLLLLALSLSASAQLKISADKRYLQTEKGQPFFWLGDTAWELFHRLSREEADLYLEDGLRIPNAYGNLPLIDADPLKPNEAYFKHVDYIVRKANKLGLIIAMLPTWGDKWNKAWGVGPEVFTPANALWFGEYLGKRYQKQQIVWVLGGDRNPVNEEDFQIVRALATGLKKGDGGKHLMTVHPPGLNSSSDFFNNDTWVDFHNSQSGHTSKSQNYKFNIKHRTLSPTRPHLDSEPRYEDHPNAFDPKVGWMDDFDVRQTGYWSMLSGACGHTYGNHNIWQFYTPQRKAVNGARTHWKVAVNHPGAMQIGLMRKVFETRPWQRLVPDQSIILGENPENQEYKLAAISQDGDFLMAYVPYGNKTAFNTKNIKGTKLHIWCYNPRDGRAIDLGIKENSGSFEYSFSSRGRGSDWLLIIDDAEKDYGYPGLKD